MDGTLNELISNKEIKFIFVGGKGGVGKTTTSSSIAIELSKKRGKTLLISTDPAHNLSDAFKQKFTSEPTQVNGLPNLMALEIDPKKSTGLKTMFKDFDENGALGEFTKDFGFMQEMLSQTPGIDEVVVFGDMMKMAKTMDVEVVVFDTAPTGHTLKLLGFPQVFEKGINYISIKNKFCIKERLKKILI